MVCEKCNATFDVKDNFCRNCGAPVKPTPMGWWTVYTSNGTDMQGYPLTRKIATLYGRVDDLAYQFRHEESLAFKVSKPLSDNPGSQKVLIEIENLPGDFFADSTVKTITRTGDVWTFHW